MHENSSPPTTEGAYKFRGTSKGRHTVDEQEEIKISPRLTKGKKKMSKQHQYIHEPKFETYANRGQVNNKGHTKRNNFIPNKMPEISLHQEASLTSDNFQSTRQFPHIHTNIFPTPEMFSSRAESRLTNRWREEDPDTAGGPPRERKFGTIDERYNHQRNTQLYSYNLYPKANKRAVY